MAKVMSVASVTDDATEIVSAQGDRTQLVIYNNGSETVYLGDDSVTTDDGFPFRAGQRRSYLGIAATELLYGISGNADGVDVRIEELFGGTVILDDASAMIDELQGVRLGLQVLTDDDLAVSGGL